MLLVAVVVHHHGPAAEVHVRADVRVADVGQVRRLAARPERRVLHLDEVADLDSVHQVRVRPQVRVRTELHAFVEATVLDVAAGLDAHAPADHRAAREATAGLDHRVPPDLDGGVDVGGGGIDERHALGHQPLVDALAHQARGLGELGAVVDAQALGGVLEPERLDAVSLLGRVADDVGDVELALAVVRLEFVEARPQQTRRDEIDAGVALLDGQLLGRGVLGLDDSRHPALLVADHPARDVARGRQHDEIGGGLRLDGAHALERLDAQQRRVSVEDEDVAREVAQRVLGHHDGVAGALPLGLQDELGALAVHAPDLVGVAADHHQQALGGDPLGHLLDVAEHGQAADLVQHLGAARLHAGALAGGQDDDGHLGRSAGFVVLHPSTLPWRPLRAIGPRHIPSRPASGARQSPDSTAYASERRTRG